MAHLEEIVVSCSVRLNTGNYEGTELFVSHKHVLDELDDPDEVQARAERMLEEAMVQRVGRAYKAQGKKVGRALIAKQHGLRTVTDDAKD